MAITEGAYYQALKWQDEIASSLMNAVNYPLQSEHLFWAFGISPRPNVVDLEHPVASATFSFSPHVVTNPSRNYRATQEIADSVRTYSPPLGSPNPQPEGVKAPSVRTPRFGTYQPIQLALFVIQRDQITPYDQRSNLVAKMRLEFRFRATPAGGEVNYNSAAIDWVRPQFRLSAIANEPSLNPIPAFVGRPGAGKIVLNRWLNLKMNY